MIISVYCNSVIPIVTRNTLNIRWAYLSMLRMKSISIITPHTSNASLLNVSRQWSSIYFTVYILGTTTIGFKKTKGRSGIQGHIFKYQTCTSIRNDCMRDALTTSRVKHDNIPNFLLRNRKSIVWWFCYNNPSWCLINCVGNSVICNGHQLTCNRIEYLNFVTL